MGENRRQSIIELIPGLSIVIILALFTTLIHGSLSSNWQQIVGKVVLGMGLGLIGGNLFVLKSKTKPGIAFSFKTLLKVAIVLLGFQISISSIIAIGGKALFLIIACMVFSFLLAQGLSKITKISSKLATLIGVGVSVCGNTAISAVAPSIKATDEEMSYAIATNTLFGVLAVFLYPILGHFLHLDDSFFGFWSGSAVNDTSQVVATSFSYSDAAGNLATTVKLTRNALMGFVIVGATLFHSTYDANKKNKWSHFKLPSFVVYFLIVVVLNSLGAFDWVSSMDPHFSKHIKSLTKFLILLALIGVGLNTNLKQLRHLGLAPLVVGFFTATLTSILSFTIIRTLLM
ncbi:MAG: putative sulfate exporter family transporter [Halobacteriovoraceae bacterium]|nr:putative sulfate exporter family transporter [Halobacteriovoraceae bacterium]